ncbi:MAG: DUF2271 domain-containing protein [Steroidobacteraceae bacterium]
MRKTYSIPLGATLGTVAALPVGAAELNVKVQLPEIQTTQYLRPYLAVWIEKADDTYVSTLSLWHMVKDKRGGELTKGDRYLNTLRSWWKQSGTTSQMPINGLSSATRAPGEHELIFTQGKAPLNTLAPGKYQLVFEAAREVKGPRPEGAAAGQPQQRPEGAEGGPRGAGGPPADNAAAGGPPAGGPPGGEPGAEGAPRGMGAGGASKDSLEVVRVNFEWPVKKVTTIKGQGKTELGNIVLTLKP